MVKKDLVLCWAAQWIGALLTYDMSHQLQNNWWIGTFCLFWHWGEKVLKEQEIASVWSCRSFSFRLWIGSWRETVTMTSFLLLSDVLFFYLHIFTALHFNRPKAFCDEFICHAGFLQILWFLSPLKTGM